MPQDSISDIIGCVNENKNQTLTKEELLRGELLVEETYLRLAKGMNTPDLSAVAFCCVQFQRHTAANPEIRHEKAWRRGQYGVFLAAAVGLPVGAVTFFLCVNPVVDMFCTVDNVACNVCSSVLLARKEGSLDEDVYRSM